MVTRDHEKTVGVNVTNFWKVIKFALERHLWPFFSSSCSHEVRNHSANVDLLFTWNWNLTLTLTFSKNNFLQNLGFSTWQTHWAQKISYPRTWIQKSLIEFKIHPSLGRPEIPVWLKCPRGHPKISIWLECPCGRPKFKILPLRCLHFFSWELIVVRMSLWPPWSICHIRIFP